MKIKICGLTNLEDAQLAIDLGASYLGFIFAKSPRQTDPEATRMIISNLKNRDNVKCVGVFVNEQIEIMEAIAKDCGLDLLQLHGDEEKSAAKTLTIPWYKAFRLGEQSDIDDMLTWPCSRYLADAKVEGLYGGTGKTISTDVAKGACLKTGEMNKEFFLAGGITPENAKGLVDAIKPDGIDVSSGIEIKPGKKDPSKMKELFSVLKGIL